MYDAVFFDLDGTLIDSAEGITSSVKYSLDKLNIKNYDPEILKKFIGPALIWAYKEYFNLDEETANKAVCYYRENYVDKAMYLNVIYDGMEDTLKELKKRGKKLFVATAKPESYARKIIDKMGLSKYFDFIVGNDPDKVRLTKEYFVKVCLDNLSMGEKAIMVGDSHFDIDGANKMNIDSVYVTYGYGEHEKALSLKPKYVIDSPKELLNIV